MKRWALPLLAFGLLSTLAAPGMAASPFTFAQFTDGTPGTVLSNTLDGSGAWLSSTLGTIAPYSVQFTFNDTSGVPPTVQATPFNDPIAANLSYTSSGAFPAASSGPSGAAQIYDPVTLQVTAVGTQVVGGITIPNGANLLTMTSGLTPAGTPPPAGTLAGTQNTQSATFFGGTLIGGNTVVFTSDYLAFDNTDLSTQDTYDGAYALSYSGVTTLPTSSPNSGIVLNGPFGEQSFAPFEAETTGTFSANLSTVPEPGSLALSAAMGLSGIAALIRRRR